jgi:hypothetical protein
MPLRTGRPVGQIVLSFLLVEHGRAEAHQRAICPLFSLSASAIPVTETFFHALRLFLRLDHLPQSGEA